MKVLTRRIGRSPLPLITDLTALPGDFQPQLCACARNPHGNPPQESKFCDPGHSPWPPVRARSPVLDFHSSKRSSAMSATTATHPHAVWNLSVSVLVALST